MPVTPPDDLSRAPAADEFEVSLFGPGVGESVVVHLGAGEWMVVDSCLDDELKQPAALTYLERLGVEVATALKLIVVTHWHDDHLRGVASLFRAAKSASLCCSAAMRVEELFGMLAVARNRSSIHDRSGIDELSELFRELKARLPREAPRGGETPIWASASKPLLERFGAGGSPRIRVEALSPSDRALKLAQLHLADELPRFKEGLAGHRLPAPTCNESAVALWLEMGEAKVLLGSDLEESADPANGWRVIVAKPRPAGSRASTLKVPHHGSRNADSPELWDKLLEPAPFALVAPFRPRSLPKVQDLERIGRRTHRLYCTADPKGRKPRRRSAATDRTMREVASRREVLLGPSGLIRLRGSLMTGAVQSVELHGGAYQVDGSP